MTLAVVGGLHSNEDGGNRLFEIGICSVDDSVSLIPEPINPIAPKAVAVFSALAGCGSDF